MFLTGDGAFKPVIEVLEEDGTVVLSDGTTVRARTGHVAGSKEDQVIPVGYPVKTAAGEDEVQITTLRAGTLYGRRTEGPKEGRLFTIEQMMASRGYHLRPDGRFVNVEGDVKTAFWEWGRPDPRLVAGERASYADIVEGADLAAELMAHQPIAPGRPI